MSDERNPEEYQYANCPGCGSAIRIHPDDMEWDHAGIHPADCPMREYYPLGHAGMMYLLHAKHTAEAHPAVSPQMAPVIDLAEYRANKNTKS